MNCSEIVYVDVKLDDNVPEYMDGIIRCSSVISEDKNGERFNHQELIDNTEYHSVDELVKDVASRLSVSEDIISIVD